MALVDRVTEDCLAAGDQGRDVPMNPPPSGFAGPELQSS
jgi:hypothetical protein